MSDRALELLKKHGRETISFQTQEPGLDYWFDDELEACVAYFDTGSAWIAAGSPLCPVDNRDRAIESFCSAAAKAGRRPRFFGLEGTVPESIAAMQVGQQPAWDPARWPEVLQKKRSLREQLRRARAKGVRVRQLSPDDLAEGSALRAKVDALVTRWRASRSMPPMGFLVRIDLYSQPGERMYFAAERDGELCAVLVAVPIYARDGWFFEDVLRDPVAPNGTVELMLDVAMRRCAERGAKLVTYGLAPLSDPDSRALRWIRDNTSWLYNFAGLRAFKAKLLPSAWHPVYLAYPRGERGVRAVLDTLVAFARGSLVRFAAATAIHLAPLVVWVLALLLLPWTALLATAPAEPWFPSPAIQIAWIAFDAALFCGLVGLALRWRPWLATSLAVAAGIDAALGVWQAAAHNALAIESAWHWLLVGLSIAAPLFACWFLLLSRQHLRLYVREPR